MSMPRRRRAPSLPADRSTPADDAVSAPYPTKQAPWDRAAAVPFDRAFASAVCLEMARGWAASRSVMHAFLRRLLVARGVVLDLGSSSEPSYAGILAHKADSGATLLRADQVHSSAVSVVIDLERPLPFRDASVDCLLLLNVLEHVFRADRLLAEARRILRPDGCLYLYVPYWIKVHRCPHDFYRYTDTCLYRLCDDSGFRSVMVHTAGGLLKGIGDLFMGVAPRRMGWVLLPLYHLLAGLDGLVDRLSQGRYSRDFPLGYFVTASPAAARTR